MGKKKNTIIAVDNANTIINCNDIKVSKKNQIEREKELKAKQIQNVHPSKKLRSSDIHRIVQHTNTSIFDEDKCCLWTGYITNLKNKRKGTYINFYFRDKKKVALHRLLYANFKENIENSDYIKYSCSNKGKCCNINHMVKFEYVPNSSDESNDNSSDTSSDDSSDIKQENFKITIF
jgi:hypothetical protein